MIAVADDEGNTVVKLAARLRFKNESGSSGSISDIPNPSTSTNTKCSEGPISRAISFDPAVGSTSAAPQSPATARDGIDDVEGVAGGPQQIAMVEGSEKVD